MFFFIKNYRLQQRSPIFAILIHELIQQSPLIATAISNYEQSITVIKIQVIVYCEWKIIFQFRMLFFPLKIEYSYSSMIYFPTFEEPSKVYGGDRMDTSKPVLIAIFSTVVLMAQNLKFLDSIYTHICFVQHRVSKTTIFINRFKIQFMK